MQLQAFKGTIMFLFYLTIACVRLVDIGGENVGKRLDMQQEEHRKLKLHF